MFRLRGKEIFSAMNKGITVLILFVVLGAMGLVFYSHTRQSADIPKEPTRESSPLSGAPVAASPASGGSAGNGPSPLQAPQGGNAGLRQIDPPLTSGQSSADGAPAPVRLTTGNTGAPVQTPPPATPPATVASPSAPSGASGSAAPDAGAPSGQDAAGRGSVGKAPSGSPELTPWGTPPTGTTPARSAEPERAPARADDAGKSSTVATAKPQTQDNGKTPAAPAAPAKEPALSDKGAHVLNDIGLHFSGQNMQLRIEADTPFPCRTFVLNSPDRLVIDLPGTWKGVKAPSVPQNRLIKAVRVGSQPNGPRIVLDLSAAPKGHKVQRNGNVVEILVQ